eukprot:206683-Prymnesium_polylepis.1
MLVATDDFQELVAPLRPASTHHTGMRVRASRTRLGERRAHLIAISTLTKKGGPSGRWSIAPGTVCAPRIAMTATAASMSSSTTRLPVHCVDIIA